MPSQDERETIQEVLSSPTYDNNLAAEEVRRMQETADRIAEEHKQLAEEATQDVKYEPHYRCNFCGKGAERVFLLVQGPGVNICNECIMEGMELIQKEVVRRETKLNKVVKFETEEE